MNEVLQLVWPPDSWGWFSLDAAANGVPPASCLVCWVGSLVVMR